MDWRRPGRLLSLSLYHELTDRWAITGGVTFTRWSTLRELRFTQGDASDRGGGDLTGGGDDVRRRDLVQPFRWEDTWRYGIGAIFALNPRITLRGGVAYDQSPVPNAQRRTPRGPDNDRVILAVGASYQWSKRFSVDTAYAYSHVRSSRISNRENPAGTQHRIHGDYQGALQSFAAQANYRF